MTLKAISVSLYIEVERFKTCRGSYGIEARRWAATDIERNLPDLQSLDEVERGNFARPLCPCHAGWEAFEQHVGLVIRLLSDRSDVVRAQALHVFDEAVRMQAAEDLRYYLEAGEEKIGEKRACHFRSIEERIVARRDRKIRRLKKRHRASL